MVKSVSHFVYTGDHAYMLFDGAKNDRQALAMKRYYMMVKLSTIRRHVSLRKPEKSH